MNIYIDIETIPDQRPTVREMMRKKLAPPGNMSKPETIEKWWKESSEVALDDKVRGLSLDPWFAQIICIGVAVEDGPVEVFWHQNDEPWLIIDALMHAQEQLKKYGKFTAVPTWVGSNILYDIRTITARAIVNKIRLPLRLPYNAKPWDDSIYDTANYFGDRESRLGMDLACTAFDIPGKGDFDGSMVYDAWKAGETRKIALYCGDDVERTRLIHKRLIGEY